MKTKRIVTAVTAILLLTITAGAQTVQTPTQYENMSRAERLGFVGEQARRIAREISGSEHEFTTEFEQDIQKFVTYYAGRIGKNRNERGAPVTDLRVVMQRGQSVAPTVNAVFRARNVSPVVGLYLAWIESEYQNLDKPSPGGALGMFQILPSTGERYGLTVEDLMDVAKSADAAARYITDSMQVFKGDPMKEVLALLAYNRGEGKTSRELKVVVNEQNKRCSICALTAERTRLDETFRGESVFYVPRFFAAAIIGENPQVFGLAGQPLSSH